MDTRAIGTKNEDVVEKFLTSKGYLVLQRNFHFGRAGEIDLICKDGDVMVFVEVKSRRSHEFGLPEDSITQTKRRVIRRTAEGYLYINKIDNVECRFDVVAVDYVTGNPEIRHWVNAFQ